MKEVIANSDTTSVPNSPPYFKGILNLRGVVISIFDLRLKLKAAAPATDKETTIVILDFAPLTLGVIVDSVDAVVAYDEKDISVAPDTDAKTKTDYLTGVARSKDALTLILDLRKVLDAEDLKHSKKIAA